MGVRNGMCVAVVLAASTLSIIDVQGALGQLPKVPSVPPVPSLQPPAKVPREPAPVPLPEVRTPVPLPEVRTPAPKLPAVQVPDVAAPAPRAPEVPVPGSPATEPSPSAAGATAVSGSGASATRPPRSRLSPRAQRQDRRARRHSAPRTKAERDLRATVTGLWACSYAVNSVQRKVLQRRAGLDGHSPTSVQGTARALDLSSRAVRRAQRTGLRGLRRANRSDGCAMGATPQGMARETRALVAVATAPALRPVADVGASTDEGRLAAASSGEGAVLGQRSSSKSRAKDGESPTRAQLAAPSDEGFPLLPLLALLVVLACGAVLVTLRRDHGAGVATERPLVPPVALREEPAPEPVDDPAPEPVHLFAPEPVHEPTPEPVPEPAQEPVDARPAPAEPRPPEGASGAHNARRLAGLAASGLASLAVGLLVRARRRR